VPLFETDIGDDREHSGSFLYLSVPWYALREIRLAIPARNWRQVSATIQDCHRTRGGTKETIRVEIWYGYQVEGRHYAGRLIRDKVLGGVQKVIDRYPLGENVMALVNPERPDESYLPSGLGYLEPLLVAIVSLAMLAILLGIPAAFIADYLSR
jgi:Protein of unknown function (DUF3592)